MPLQRPVECVWAFAVVCNAVSAPGCETTAGKSVPLHHFVLCAVCGVFACDLVCNAVTGTGCETTAGKSVRCMILCCVRCDLCPCAQVACEWLETGGKHVSIPACISCPLVEEYPTRPTTAVGQLKVAELLICLEGSKSVATQCLFSLGQLSGPGKWRCTAWPLVHGYSLLQITWACGVQAHQQLATQHACMKPGATHCHACCSLVCA